MVPTPKSLFTLMTDRSFNAPNTRVVVQLHSSLTKMIRYLIGVTFLVGANAPAEEPRTWIGPKIDSINTLEGGTLLDVVNQIRAEINKAGDSSISVRIEVSDDDLRKIHADMALRNIPAVVALSYVASAGRYKFAFDKGVWVLRNPPIHEREYDDDDVTVTCELASSSELAALGLVVKSDGSVSVQEGPRWPKEEWGAIKRIDDVLVLRAYRREIEDFHALLRLHRRGFQTPKINSEQNGGGQPATNSASK